MFRNGRPATHVFRIFSTLVIAIVGVGATAVASGASSEDPDLYPARALDPTNQNIATFGQSAASAGDVNVNGDGFDDMVAGAPGWDGEEMAEGRAHVYLGSATGLQASPATFESDQNGARFGFSVGTAGDVDSDGYDDVVVSTNVWDGQETDEGRAYVYLGSVAGLQASPTTLDPTDQPTAFFGISIGTAGDINSDGYDDVVVGAFAWDGEQDGEGRVYLYMRRIAPVFEPRSDKIVHEGETFSFRVRATDANFDPLTYSATDLPNGATFDPGTRRFNWASAYEDAGDYEVTFTVSDGERNDTQTVGITVLNTVIIEKTTPSLSLSVSKTTKAIKGSGTLTPPHEGSEIFITLSRKVSGEFKKIVTNRDHG